MSHRSLGGFQRRVTSKVVLGQAAGSFFLATCTKRQKALCVGLVVVRSLALRTRAESPLAASFVPVAPAFCCGAVVPMPQAPSKEGPTMRSVAKY